jgi:hypothetical protein
VIRILISHAFLFVSVAAFAAATLAGLLKKAS